MVVSPPPGARPGAGGTRLDAAVTLAADGDGWAWDVPDGWQQGRGAYGGLVLTGLLRAVEAVGGTGRRVRAVSAQIVAPLPVGSARVEVEPVKVGSAVSTYSASLRSPEGESYARAVAVLAGDRDVPAPDRGWGVAAGDPPEAPAWPHAAVVPLGAPVAPVFLQHVEVRPVRGVPLAADADEVVAWVRFRRPDAAAGNPDAAAGDPDYDAVGLIALVDVMWPVALVRMPTPRPLATLTFDASVLVDPATLDPGAPLLHRGRVVDGAAGYLREVRELWSPDGRLVAHNVQTLVVIR